MLKAKRRIRSVLPGMGLCALLIVMIGAISASADDARSLSARLSDEAFALLGSVSGKRDTPSPLLGPVGVLAADSQKLSSALQAGNLHGAGAAMAAVKSDAAAVDKAAASGGLDAAKWTAIKHDLDALSAIVPASPGAAAAAASTDSVPSAAPAAGGESHPGPAVRIESAQMAGPDVLRIKGYMSGHGLRTAGIYQGETRVAKLDVKRVAGDQMIRFDLQIHGSAQGEVLRVYDSAGRSAQAPIAGDTEAPGPVVSSGPEIIPPPPSESPPPPPPSLDSDDNVALGGGDDLDSAESGRLASNPPDATPSEDNTKEIPAAIPPLSGPKRRMRSHLRARRPNDVRIRIDSVTAVDPGMHDYMVRGQITGSDLEKAGIYVDGRLAQEIGLNSGAGLRISDFAQSFSAVGSEATIRVYRTRRDYSETSINLATAETSSPSTSPLVINSAIGGALGGGPNAGQLAVQITSVQAATPSLYVVSGIISGHNIASAGIYQNGVLAQPLDVSGGGGIGGLISGLIPGTSRQISFVGRFNPAQGFATVRAYDRSGLMTEQPISSGGSYGVNPYGGINTYR
ncbi:MAG TPA: hypothetical protein VGH29_10650, partial [Candidatus Binataceae bacterium]